MSSAPFLLAPLAILALFYVIFASVDRSGRASGNNGHTHHEPDEAPPEQPAVQVTRAPEPEQYAPARTPAGVGAARTPPAESVHAGIPQAPPPTATYPGAPPPPAP